MSALLNQASPGSPSGLTFSGSLLMPAMTNKLGQPKIGHRPFCISLCKAEYEAARIDLPGCRRNATPATYVATLQGSRLHREPDSHQCMAKICSCYIHVVTCKL